MKLESGWVPVALSMSIEPGTSAGAVVEGVEVVVWRDVSGKAHVWEDRCPHRGMRMSFGFVRGDHIACLYHGWQYDTAGQCRHIPAHPDLEVPETIKVPTYKATEHFGVIWATSGEGSMPPVALEASSVTPVRSLYVDAPMTDVIAALQPAQFNSIGDACGTITVEGVTLLAALQVAGPNRSAIHIVALAGLAPAALKTLAAWMENLRLRIEAPTLVAEVA